MRFATVIFLAVGLLVVVATAKDNKKQAPACSRDCGDKYDPICAQAKNKSKERLITFGNDCVMSNYNCQHPDDQFETKTKGECGGNVSVRLS